MSVDVASNSRRYKMIYQLNKLFGFRMPIDGPLSLVTHQIEIDLIKLDNMLTEHDSDYNGKITRYKGLDNISMSAYIRIKFGEEAHVMIQKLINYKDENQSNDSTQRSPPHAGRNKRV